MKSTKLVLLGVGSWLALIGGACGGGEVTVDTDTDSLRAALTRSTDQLEMEDVRTRGAVAERLLAAARAQIEDGDSAQVARAENEAPIDAIERADDGRAEQQRDPLVIAAVRSEAELVTIRATGRAELMTSAAVSATEASAAVRVGEGFATDPSEALGGRSELETADALGALLVELGAELDAPADSWVVMRRPGLRAGIAFLPEEGIVELNPTLLYYFAALDRPGYLVAEAPAALNDPSRKPPASEWEVFVRWLEEADPTSWTNLNTAPGQTMDGGSSEPFEEPTPVPAGCPCCFCSSSGLGWQGQGLAALFVFVLPLGVLFTLRRRA